MGDMKAQARGVDAPAASGAADPFADLADMFETEIARSHRVIEDDIDFEAEFADALAVDVARSLASAVPAPAAQKPLPANSAQQSWVAPRAVRLADPLEDRGGYGAASMVSGQRSALALQADLEQALRGLSAPANPRQSIIVETQSFAPQRVVDEPVEDLSTPERDEFDELIASELAVMHRHEPQRAPVNAAGGHARRPLPSGVDYTVAIEDGDPSGSYDEDDEAGAGRRTRRRFLSRSTVMLGGGVAALALVGAIGLALWSPGQGGGLSSGSGDPLLIKADTTPFKTVPKDPGGRSIPNQNKAVYDRVAAAPGQTAPQQQALLTDAEEPIDLPPEGEDMPGVYDDSLPGVDLVDNEGLGLKDEGRIETASTEGAETETAPTLQPRKVRTMVVRPDGSIVPSEMPAPIATEALATPAMSAPPLIEIASAAPRVEAPVPLDVAPEAPVVEIPAPVAAPEPVAEASPMAPDVDPQSSLPVQVADPIEVAAIQPAPPPVAAMPSGGYFVQISSQPSEALAQKSLQSLGSKFSSVIEGRAVGIQAAEIPGKGTFYRVRVAAESKNEAANLCNRLKAAGGNCFVAR